MSTPAEVQAPAAPKLHELVIAANSITAAIVAAGGELTPELEAELAATDVAVAAKVDGYAHVIARLEMEAEYWGREAELRNRISRAMTNLVGRRKQAIKAAMEALGKTEVVGNSHRFQIQRSTPALSVDPALVPAEYTMVVTERVPDKVRIREALDQGKVVPGARLVAGSYVRPYVNRGAAATAPATKKKKGGQ